MLWSYVTNKVLFKYAPTLLAVKLGKKPRTEPKLLATPAQTSWGAGGSRIFPMQARLYGWFSLVYGWGGHISNVMYPSGFSAICRVHCTKAEMCGVDSPRPGQTCHLLLRSQHGNCSWKTTTHKHNSTIKMKKCTNVNMQAQKVRGVGGGTRKTSWLPWLTSGSSQSDASTWPAELVPLANS